MLTSINVTGYCRRVISVCHRGTVVCRKIGSRCKRVIRTQVTHHPWRWLSTSTVLFIVIIIGWIALHHALRLSTAPEQSTHTRTVTQLGTAMQQHTLQQQWLQRIHALTKQVNALQQQMATQPNQKDLLHTLQQQVNTLLQHYQQVMLSAMHQVAQQTLAQHQSVQQALRHNQQQTQTVEKQLRQLHQQLTPHKFLSPRVLPFHVVGIDVWNGQLMATVLLRDIHGGAHYQLMGQGMQWDCRSSSVATHHCTRWTVKQLSLQPAEVIFNNQQGQQVKVIL